MAKVKEVLLGRRHQMAVCRAARRTLRNGSNGLVLADGVGLGKTYEALGTVASLLAQRQHGKEAVQLKPFRVLCLVPPGLVTKWADELILPEKFRAKLKSWRAHAHQAVVDTFTDVVVIRRRRDLEDTRGELRYGRHELPGGFYIVNCNLLSKEGRKVTQIHRTGWDAIIVDEAHHLGSSLLDLKPHTLFSNAKTATLLLTATPFQLSPQELKGLLAMTFGGYGDPSRRSRPLGEATALYDNSAFSNYRRHLAAFFNLGQDEMAALAARQRGEVEVLLRPRIIRNRKNENRRYHLVDRAGVSTPLPGSPFHLERESLRQALAEGGTIGLTESEARAYLEIRSGLLDASTQRERTFMAGALRQLLSTWSQFRHSKSGEMFGGALPSTPHPKAEATVRLVARLLAKEVAEAGANKWVGKVLIFTTYVGAERDGDVPMDDRAHGTASALKRALLDRLAVDYPRAPRGFRRALAERLLAVLNAEGGSLPEQKRAELQRTIRMFAGSAPARLLLATDDRQREEQMELRQLLRDVPPEDAGNLVKGDFDEEKKRRLEERRARLIQQISDRYSTRDLVARYDGATPQEERDRHLRGFNSPFAPLVLIASSVGQEGIDLQRYCRHVIHHDLEWNPAKLEQREGRVDRQGRLASGPVNVYFLICRGTYDERVMHSMVNRFRWHQVLLANRRKLEAVPGEQPERYAEPKWMQKVALDLRPAGRLPGPRGHRRKP